MNPTRDLDSPSPDDDRRYQAIERILPNTAGSVGGALVGLAVGGPVGAVAGAAITPAATALVALVSEALRRRARRAEEVLAGAANMLNQDVTVLEATLVANDDLLAVAILALTAAADAPLAEKRNAFSRLIAQSSAGDQVQFVDKYTLAAHALAALDAAHIRLLAVVSSRQEDKSAPESGWTPEELATHFSEATTTLRPLVRLLELHGLITDVGNQTDQGPDAVYWQITTLGTFLLELLDIEENLTTDMKSDPS